jgi:uncharacterized delta-60 repeat protein
VVQPDGKILVGGDFVVPGQVSDRLARLNPDGTVDTSFEGKANISVQSMALLPGGKILLAGWFNELCGEPCRYLGRLNADGSRDTNFVSSADNLIYSLAIEHDGRILVGGQITMLSGQPCKYLGCLNPENGPDVTHGSRAAPSER